MGLPDRPAPSKKTRDDRRLGQEKGIGALDHTEVVS